MHSLCPQEEAAWAAVAEQSKTVEQMETTQAPPSEEVAPETVCPDAPNLQRTQKNVHQRIAFQVHGLTACLANDYVR